MQAKPSAEYLDRIVNGARRHGLPEAYIHDVVAIASDGAVGQRRPDHKPGIRRRRRTEPKARPRLTRPRAKEPVVPPGHRERDQAVAKSSRPS